jgi:DNA-binding sugar fermentation-stimulating protein
MLAEVRDVTVLANETAAFPESFTVRLRLHNLDVARANRHGVLYPGEFILFDSRSIGFRVKSGESS